MAMRGIGLISGVLIVGPFFTSRLSCELEVPVLLLLWVEAA